MKVESYLAILASIEWSKVDILPWRVWARLIALSAVIIYRPRIIFYFNGMEKLRGDLKEQRLIINGLVSRHLQFFWLLGDFKFYLIKNSASNINAQILILAMCEPFTKPGLCCILNELFLLLQCYTDSKLIRLLDYCSHYVGTELRRMYLV